MFETHIFLFGVGDICEENSMICDVGLCDDKLLGKSKTFRVGFINRPAGFDLLKKSKMLFWNLSYSKAE